MMAKRFSNQVSALMKKGKHEGPYVLESLAGGKNNRVFIVHGNDQCLGVLKQYYHKKADPRDRLDSEWRFLSFLWSNNIRQVPEPLACDPGNHIAFYRYISGKKLVPEKISDDHIYQTMDFFLSLNSFRMTKSAQLLPNASEACFSLGDHIHLVDRRIQKLEQIRGRSAMDDQAREFVSVELLPLWHTIRSSAFHRAEDRGLSTDNEMAAADKRLSPSDFGFHNALEDDNGRLFFLDFEYAGWDDPAKTVCDFFCQPAIPVPWRYLPHIIDNITRDMDDPEIQRQRIELLLPVYQIKWSCVVLNEFLPWGHSRRIFMDSASDPDLVKGEQLQKARRIIQDIQLKV